VYHFTRCPERGCSLIFAMRSMPLAPASAEQGWSGLARPLIEVRDGDLEGWWCRV
jgi:hypothetical protein